MSVPAAEAPAPEFSLAKERLRGRVLLLDADKIAGRALRGILERGDHECIVSESVPAAWQSLRGQLGFTLLVAELSVPGEDVHAFVQRIRKDAFLRQLPIIVYTSVTDRNVVRRVLGMRVQNYLLKPYVDEHVYREVERSMGSAWQQALLPDADAFSREVGIHPSEARKRREDLISSTENLVRFLTDHGVAFEAAQVRSKIEGLAERGEAAGFAALRENLAGHLAAFEKPTKAVISSINEDLEYALRLLRFDRNPSDALTTAAAEPTEQEKAEQEQRRLWERHDLSTGPLFKPEAAKKLAEGLKACPVLDTIAASFLMTAEKGGEGLAQLEDMVGRDPGLAANVLIATAKLDLEDVTGVETPADALGLLGSVRIAALARTIPSVEERWLKTDSSTWEQFWRFQVAVARFAQFACREFELEHIMSAAHTAGLIHSIGRLVMARLYPHALPVTVKLARERCCALEMAERAYTGLDSRELGYHYATAAGLSRRFANVIRWADTPTEADEDQALVGVIALSRQFCIQNKVGACFDPAHRTIGAIEVTPAWQVMRDFVFPSFNLRAFERRSHAFCVSLQQSLNGRQ